MNANATVALFGPRNPANNFFSHKFVMTVEI